MVTVAPGISAASNRTNCITEQREHTVCTRSPRPLPEPANTLNRSRPQLRQRYSRHSATGHQTVWPGGRDPGHTAPIRERSGQNGAHAPAARLLGRYQEAGQETRVWRAGEDVHEVPPRAALKLASAST